jgi:hypothetical protein
VLEASPSNPGVAVTCYHPSKPSSRTVILVSPNGDSSPAPFLAQGFNVVVLRHFSTGTPPDQFADFFTTYNRTEAQERVRDLVRICFFARGHLKARQVILCGAGRAGLWAMLAAPAADAVVADCDQLDLSTDATLLAPDLFCPGLRSLGAFEGAALLAAPNPLLLHNAGDKFPTEALHSEYRSVGASAKLRIASQKLAPQEIVKWMTALK